MTQGGPADASGFSQTKARLGLAAMSTESSRRQFATSLIAGSIAGWSVDVVLFPLDTMKTRLQAVGGFANAGGFRGIYKGLAAAAIGSAPGAAIFFGTYTLSNAEIQRMVPTAPDPLVHMASASLGELVACFVRVPTEIVKQRTQAGHYPTSAAAVRDILSTNGAHGLLRGYSTTIAREIPFALVQFPLYEHFKVRLRRALNRPPKAWEAALAGSAAGAIAATVTNPIDVAKTRIMLASDARVQTNAIAMIAKVAREEGVRQLFAGVLPRVCWISIGGFVFFGSFEAAQPVVMDLLFGGHAP